MKASDIRVCVMVMEGTNNEASTFDAFRIMGANPEIVHINQFQKKDLPASLKRSIDDYQCLIFPGGFSAGDHVRAGAIWASRIRAALSDDLSKFVSSGYPVGGICNGFQVLVELGLLPGNVGILGDETKDGSAVVPDMPNAVLSRNESGRFECRHVLLKHVSRGKCAWTRNISSGAVLEMPVAHGEGNFTLPCRGWRSEAYDALFDDDRVVFQYADNNGAVDPPYPWNPNGSYLGIAGVCNEAGNVFGMMPHPERVMTRYTCVTGASARGSSETGPGYGVFSSVVDYISRRF